MINRAEPRACGCSRRSRRLDTKWPETDERHSCVKRSPKGFGRAQEDEAGFQPYWGKPAYGMNRGGGGNVGMTRGLFATDARKGGYKRKPIRSKPVAPPLHSTSLIGRSRSSRCQSTTSFASLVPPTSWQAQLRGRGFPTPSLPSDWSPSIQAG